MQYMYISGNLYFNRLSQTRMEYSAAYFLSYKALHNKSEIPYLTEEHFKYVNTAAVEFYTIPHCTLITYSMMAGRWSGVTVFI